MFGKEKKKQKRWNALEEAVKQDAGELVTTLAKDLSLGGKKEYYNACVTAIKSNAPHALEALLEAGGGFNFSRIVIFLGDSHPWDHSRGREREENCKLAHELIKEAYASPNPGSILPALYKNRKNGNLEYGKLPFEDFLNKDSPVELLGACLEDESAPSAFSESIEKTGLYSTEKLEFILTFSSEKNSNTLMEALVKVAAAGDMDKAALLLERNANPNANKGKALLCAAQHDHKEMVDFLIPHTRLDLFGKDIITKLEMSGAEKDIITTVETATRDYKSTSAPEAGAEAQEASVPGTDTVDSYSRLNDHTLAEIQALPNGSTITTLFNFNTKQQKSFVTSKEGFSSPTETITLDKDVIASMREKFEALAGQETPRKAEEVPQTKSGVSRDIIKMSQ